MHTRRHLAALAAFALAAGLAAPAPAERPTPVPHQVLAFYYGWYGNPRVSGHWVHWKPAGDGVHATNIADTPYDGLYDSHDPAELAREATLARDAGITGFIASWWGQDDFTDAGMAPLLAAAGRAGLKVTAYLEDVEGADEPARAAQAEADLLYLLRRYGADPAWLRVGGKKPVVFVYGRAAGRLPLPAWAHVLARVRAEAPSGLAAIGPHYDPAWLAVFDGAHDYNITGAIHALSPLGMAQWAVEHYRGQVAMAAAAGGKVACATVIPGYDDSHTDRPPPRPITNRDDGRTYAVLWQSAIVARPDWVLITSWNEWHEGTEVEPSRQYGPAFVGESRQWSTQFLSRRKIQF